MHDVDASDVLDIVAAERNGVHAIGEQVPIHDLFGVGCDGQGALL